MSYTSNLALEADSYPLRLKNLLWGAAVIRIWLIVDQSDRLRAQLRSLLPSERFFPRLVLGIK
jgi:hypothetical protein